jgi:DNA processing protein
VVDALRPAASLDAHEERLALLRLLAVAGVGPRRLRAAVDTVGSGRRILALDARPRAAALEVARAEPGPAAEASAILERCRVAGVEPLAWGEERYPPRLRHLSDPPPILYVIGDAWRLHDHQVAVVGSRRATAYGRRSARALAGELARAGLTVLSGMALGIDGEAHAGALAAGGPSTAVLGSGAERAQPRRHTRLHRELVRVGAVASEHPPGTPALGHHFPARNRLLAALASAVLVVEAAERSGALITVREAAALGRDVLAVPGPIDAGTSRGTNALIRDGATPVLDGTSLLATLGVTLGVAGPDVRPAAARPPVTLGPDADALWAALESRPLGVDALARTAGLDAPRALAALARLELEGWVSQDVGFRFRRRTA